MTRKTAPPNTVHIDAETVRDNPLETLIVDETTTSLAERIEEEMAASVALPSEKRFVAALVGAVGVGEATHRPIALDDMAERTPADRALTLLLGAWAGWVLNPDAHNVRFVAKPMMSKIAGTGTWRALRDDGWIVKHADDSIGLRHRRVTDAVARLHRRYAAEIDIDDEE